MSEGRHGIVLQKICLKGHILECTVADADGNSCDVCKRRHIKLPETIWRCDTCDYDLCMACYDKAPPLASAPHSPTAPPRPTEAGYDQAAAPTAAPRDKQMDDCPICLECCEEPMHTMSCGHQLHKKCWEESCRYGHNRCPLCRAPVTNYARARYHPRVRTLATVSMIGLIAIVLCGLASFWSWEAVSEIQGALWSAVIPSSGPSTHFFNNIDFSMCAEAEGISGMLGCVFLTTAGYVCLWFFFSVLLGALRLPFILWHISGKLGMSMLSRPIFWLLGMVLTFSQVALLLMITIGVGGLCFTGAQRSATRRPALADTPPHAGLHDDELHQSS